MAIPCPTIGGIGTFRLITATDSEGIHPPLVVNPPREARWTNNLRTDFDDFRAGLKGRGADLVFGRPASAPLSNPLASYPVATQSVPFPYPVEEGRVYPYMRTVQMQEPRP